MASTDLVTNTEKSEEQATLTTNNQTSAAAPPPLNPKTNQNTNDRQILVN